MRFPNPRQVEAVIRIVDVRILTYIRDASAVRVVQYQLCFAAASVNHNIIVVRDQVAPLCEISAARHVRRSNFNEYTINFSLD
jgi:hypothetical protein|tara:strand:- start:1002 stop:1250 length:249 start_codon:yes stop_codon:yes gene_type:complete